MPDFKKTDLLIVMGTSLSVQPFAGLIKQVSSTCPRILINMECVGECDDNVMLRRLQLQRNAMSNNEEMREMLDDMIIKLKAANVSYYIIYNLFYMKYYELIRFHNQILFTNV